MELSADEIGRAEVEQGRLYRRVMDFFDTYDLLVTPTTVVPPFEKACRYPDRSRPWPSGLDNRNRRGLPASVSITRLGKHHPLVKWPVAVGADVRAHGVAAHARVPDEALRALEERLGLGVAAQRALSEQIGLNPHLRRYDLAALDD